MTEILFLGCLAGALALLYAWAFRTLPGERWQFIASTPDRRAIAAGTGVNFTFYGFFSATAYAVSAGLFLTLMASVGVPLAVSLAAVSLTLLICAPASQLIAWAVEGKRYGFTIGGASFVGLFVAPATFWALDRFLGPAMGFSLPLGPALAAMAIAYVLGESLGRLACISFGCCYGKPVSAARGWVRVFSDRFSFVFEGKTKKIAYASKLDGVPVVPVQAMTATLYGVTAVASVALFLNAYYHVVIPLALATAQIWRTYSETFRADYRGEGDISVYQWMAAGGALAVLAAPFLLGHSPVRPDLTAGLAALWSPEALVFLQAVWLAAFFYMGRSMQTGSRVSYHVRHDRI